MTDSSREQRRVAALVAQYIQELSGQQNQPEPVHAPPPEGALK
jgi:hypothetical protein